MARPQLPPSSRPTYFGGTPTSSQGYNPPQRTVPSGPIPATENYAPDAQQRREVERYIADNPLSTAQQVDYGALQFAENYGPYEGPDNMGVPQIAAARLRSAEAVVRAGLTPERAKTLEQYPNVTKALVNAGLMIYPVRASDTFPEGDPRAAMRQLERMAQVGAVNPGDIVEEDVARLLNVVEIDAAANKYLQAGAMGDLTRQNNILSSMGMLDQIALLDTVYAKAEEIMRDPNSLPDWANNTLHLLEYVVDGFWWLNNQAQHAYRANMLALQENPALALQAVSTFGMSTVPLTVANWNRTEAGNYNQEQINKLKQQYPSEWVNVAMDLTTEMQRQRQQQYVWNEPSDPMTPFETVFAKYKDNPAAQEFLRGIIYTETQDDAATSLMLSVDAASLANGGQLTLSIIPDDILASDSMLRENAANAINVYNVFALDPTLGVAKIARGYKIARYTLMKAAPGADVAAALTIPKVNRSVTDLARRVQKYRDLRAAERAGTARAGSAANYRVAMERAHADFAPVLDDLIAYNGTGIRSVDDFAMYLEGGASVGNVLAGQPVVAAERFGKMYGAQAARGRRDPLLPRMGVTRQGLSRVREELAINGLQARVGSKRLDRMFGATGVTDSENVAAVLNDAATAIGSKYGIAERPFRSLLELAPGSLFRRRPPTEARTIDGQVLPVESILARPEKVIGRYAYADTSLYGRLDRLVKLFARKPNAAIIGTATGEDAAKIYTFARTFFTRYEARAIADAFRNGTQATRINIRNGLVRSAAEIAGVRVRYGDDADAVIDDLITGNRSWEQYSPTRVYTRDANGNKIEYNPSTFNNTNHPLHLWQTSDYVKLPDLADIERFQQRAGFWNSMFGFYETQGMKNVTDAWSLGTLVGPRFVARSAIEDWVMWSMTSGSWLNAAKGRGVSTAVRAFRDGLRRPAKNLKFQVGAATYSGDGSYLGIINRNLRKPRSERLRDVPETNNALGRFVLDHLDEVEQDLLVTAIATGDKQVQRRLLGYAIMRSEGIGRNLTPFQARGLSSLAIDGYVQSKLDDALEQATQFNSVATQSGVVRTIEDIGIMDGVTLARMNYDVKFTDIAMANASAGDLARWYRSISGAVQLDGPVGTVGVANIPKWVNGSSASRKAIIDDLANVIRTDKQFRYSDRLAALREPGVTPEVFAQRYMDDVANLFSTSTGDVNMNLWRKVVRTTRDPQTGAKTTEVNMYRLKADYLGSIPGNQRPNFILGRETIPVPNLAGIGGMDKIWSVMGAQYSRISRDPLWTANYSTELKRLEPFRDRLAAQIGDDQADFVAFRLAADNAYNLTLAYSDNPANRTVFAWRMRNVARYYRATEDFFRRMMRVTKNYPEGLWKIMLTYDALEETGFVWENENEEKYFLYPFMGQVGQFLAGGFASIGKSPYQISPFEVGGKVTMLMPSSDPNQMIPSVTFLGALPFKAIFQIAPQFDALERAVLGEYGRDASPIESILPSAFLRVWSSVPDEERNQAYGNAVKSAVQIAVASGLQPIDPKTGLASTDPQDVADFERSIANIAYDVLKAKALMGFVFPASPQLIPGDVTNIGRSLGVISMNSAARQMIDAYGDDPYAWEKGMVDFYETFGGQAMAYTVGSTKTAGADKDATGLLRTSALESVTDDARKWVQANGDVVDKFPVASTYLFPRTGDFDIKMWAWLQTEGYKEKTKIGEHLRSVLGAEGSFMYNQTEKYLLELQETGQPFTDASGSYEVTDDFISEQLNTIRYNYPWLDIKMGESNYTTWIGSLERLINGTSTSKGEVRQMIDYYYSNEFKGEIPQSVAKITEALETFDYWKQQRDLVSSQTADARAYRSDVDAYLTEQLDAIASEDPNAMVFIDRVLKPLMKPNLYGAQQQIPPGVLVGR